jgi:hypothetical protein
LAGVVLKKLSDVAENDAFIAFDLNKNGVAAAVFPKLADRDRLGEVYRLELVRLVVLHYDHGTSLFGGRPGT